jgi:hypothetical protein
METSKFLIIVNAYLFDFGLPQQVRILYFQICRVRQCETFSIRSVEGEKTGDGISYASHVKNPNPLKATTFYDPVHNALDKEAQCAWKEGEGSHWPSVYIQKPFMTL